MRMTAGPIVEARFLERPNRFIVRAEVAGVGRVRAFLANPGRLHELLLPGVKLWLSDERGVPGRSSAIVPPRKTKWTVQAVQRDDRPICLNTHRANDVAATVIDRDRVPAFAGAKVVDREVRVGSSRFDLLVDHEGRDVLVEVKSVTLYGNGVAMFPDAVTERGRRHLEQLAELADAGRPTAVLFIIHTPDVRWFMPDYHTDLGLARTLIDVRHRLAIHAVAVNWREDLCLGSTCRPLEIPWDLLDREVRDAGGYVLLLRLKRRRRVAVGELGRIPFEPGHYLYAGSAMRGLTRRVERHLRRRKKMRWHIDYLRDVADDVKALPIRSSRRNEPAIVEAMSRIARPAAPGFGASDSPHLTHLFHRPDSPLDDPAFHRELQTLRMRHPGG